MNRLIFLLIFPFVSFSQTHKKLKSVSKPESFNGYKYVVISKRSDPFELGYDVSKELEKYGFYSFVEGEKVYSDFIDCQALYCELSYTPAETISQKVKLTFKDCDGVIISKSKSSCAVCAATVKGELRKAAIKAVSKSKWIKNYVYDSSILSHLQPSIESIPETRRSLTTYYDSTNLHSLEGIYKSTEGNGNSYTIGVKKFDNLFKAIIIESENEYWSTGDVKIIINKTATKNLYSVNYFLANKKMQHIFQGFDTPGLLSFQIDKNFTANYIKMYPQDSDVKSSKIKNGEWAGNGSGIIISKSGHIITNHHVIDGADDIEVEFILDEEVQKFNAEIVQIDKVNDLAIIKIFDMNFDGLDNLPYNFKTRSSDVGTKVYAYGYPMALSLMGKEIKITDGIISSKSGFDGDITTYQITAPIQGGNSGGPLFDDKGNFLGINSSGLRKDIADNVGYTIKTSYVLNLIDVLPKNIDLPSNTKLQSLPLTEQIKEISKCVVLVKVK